MATHRALPRSRVMAILVAVGVMLSLAGPGWAGAQGGTPQVPAPPPFGPLALDSNPPALPLVPPSNDNFDGAWNVGSLTYRVTEDTREATTQTGDPYQTCVSATHQGSHSVWFAYTPAANTDVTATTYNSDYDTVLSIYTGSWGALTQVACNDDIQANSILASSVRLNLTAGTTYYFDVTSWSTSPGGTLVFSVRLSLPGRPGNDEFDQAFTVPPTLPQTAAQDVTGATTNMEDPLQGQTGQTGDCSPAQNELSVWYKYTAPSSDPVTAYTYGAGYDTVMSIYTGSAITQTTEIVCNDDQNGTLQSQVTFTPTLGTTYYFDVTREKNAYEPPINWLALDVVLGAPPPNDNFASARGINTAPYTDTVDASLATLEAADPTIPVACVTPASRNSRSVWYRYSPTAPVMLVVDTGGSDYDTVLAVWVGNNPGNLSIIGCNDDHGSPQSRLTVETQPGMTYYIEVVSKGTQPAGQLVLSARPYAAQWQTLAPMTLARDRLAAAGNGTYLFVLGGERYVTDSPAGFYAPTPVVSRYDPVTNLWVDMQPMPVALQDHKAVYVGGKIYIPSGYAGSGPPFYGTHLVYDVATNSWSTAAPGPWPSGRPPVYYALASDGQGYYLTGGYDGAYILSNVWYYHVASNTWTPRTSMPLPRYGHESAVLGGYLYVVAGDNNSTIPGLFSTLRFDPALNSWIQVGSQNYDRVFAASGVIPATNSPGLWYLTGGGFSSYGIGGALGETEVFDAIQNTWELLPVDYSLTVPRYLLAGAVHHNEFYTFGGYIGGTPGLVNTTERLTVSMPTAVRVTMLRNGMPPAAFLAAGLAGLSALIALAALARRR